MQFPEAEIEDFGKARFAEGVKTIFMGHFHRQYFYSNRDSKSLYILPDWFSTQKVAIYSRDTGEVRFVRWEELAT